MEPEGSLQWTQQLTTCPYPEPDESHPSPLPHFLTNLNIMLPSTLISSKWFFPTGLPTKTLHVPLLSPYVPYAQPISFLFILPPE
jgi:hypothetical protein